MLVSYVISTFVYPCPTATFRPPPLLNRALTHTRIEARRLDIREVETQGPLVVAAPLCSQVACPYGRRGCRIRLSGEARVGRTLRKIVEVRKGGRVL